MKNIKLLISLLLLIIPSALFAQRSTGNTPTTFDISIRCNAKAFTVFVDKQRINGNKASLKAGSHVILVKAQGYNDWQQTFNITASQNINVNMTPAILKHRLTISSNVNSSIFINNKMVANDNFNREMDAGTYSITVRSNGFKDYKATVKLDRDTNIKASLIPNQFKLSIRTNVNSSIFINDKQAGNNSFNKPMNPGTYSIVVRSNGFMDFKTTVNLDRDTNVNAVLMPLMASISIFIPPALLNKNVKNSANKVRIYDNGVLLNGYNFELPAGNHTIRIETGGFAIEGNYTFAPGQKYNIEPGMYLNVK